MPKPTPTHLRECLLSERSAVYVFLILSMFGLFYLMRSTHKEIPQNSWKNHLFSDPGGYFAYLPATYHGWDHSEFPADLDKRLGNVMRINWMGKISLKYTCGVALMQSPFYFATAVSNAGNPPKDGFSGPFRMVPFIAASVWFVLACWWLFLFLRRYFPPWICIASIALIALGTNVSHYLVMEPGFSHIYTFSLVCALLLTTKKLLESDGNQWGRFILWSGIMALIVLTRPTNILFVSVVFLDLKSWREMGPRLKAFFTWKRILVGAVVGLVVISPQLVFWKYSSGDWIHYSYGDEGFTNWASPKFMDVLFAPKNGLFLYNPLYLMLIPALAWMTIKKAANTLLISIVLLVTLYITASWHMPSFGCSFGMRNMVDLAPFMVFVVALLLNNLKNRKWFILAPIGILLLASSYTNLRLSHNYTRCYLCEDAWDWDEYRFFLLRNSWTDHHSFETENTPNHLQVHNAYDGDQVYQLKPQETFYPFTDLIQKDVSNVHFRMAGFNIKVMGEQPVSDGLTAVFVLKHKNEELLLLRRNLGNSIKPGEWKTIKWSFPLPSNSPRDAEIQFYIENKSNADFLLDGVNVRLH